MIAILPGFDPTVAQEYADITIATGLDQARNLIVANSDAIIAIGGVGTLTEIAYAWSLKRLILAFDLPGWSSSLSGQRVDQRQRYPDIPEDQVYKVTTSGEAIEKLKLYLPKYTRRHSHIQIKNP